MWAHPGLWGEGLGNDPSYPATPVTGDANAPLARAVTLEGMKPEARRVGATRICSLLETEQDSPKPWRVTGG